jgi:hypothetical protein
MTFPIAHALRWAVLFLALAAALPIISADVAVASGVINQGGRR